MDQDLERPHQPEPSETAQKFLTNISLSLRQAAQNLFPPTPLDEESLHKGNIISTALATIAIGRGVLGGDNDLATIGMAIISGKAALQHFLATKNLGDN